MPLTASIQRAENVLGSYASDRTVTNTANSAPTAPITRVNGSSNRRYQRPYAVRSIQAYIQRLTGFFRVRAMNAAGFTMSQHPNAASANAAAS